VPLDQFLDAIRRGDVTQVQRILESEPALLSARDDQGVSPVLTAVYHGQSDVLRELMALRPDLSVHEAAATGQSRRVRAWLDEDPGLATSFSPDGYTALGLASFFGHLDVANLLLGRGAEVNTASRNEMRVMPLHSAVAGRHLAIAQVLLEHGADPNAASHGGWTPIHGAADHGQVEMVRLLLDHGARPDVRNDEGLTPADMAAAKGHVQAGDMLVRRGG
jgi:ankyrin repeat protein